MAMLLRVQSLLAATSLYSSILHQWKDPSTLLVAQAEGIDGAAEYGVDVSFPIHHARISTNYPWLAHNSNWQKNDNNSSFVPERYKDMPPQPLGDRQTFYDEFLDGCVQKFGKKKGARCHESERDRIEMNLRQPQSMRNYTATGFTKVRAPDDLFRRIQQFWSLNKGKEVIESWGVGNTYTNNWASPTFMVSVEDKKLRGGGMDLKKEIWNAATATVQEWTGEELTQCSLYGIRVYKENAVLSPHVDRLPLVSSAIISIAQDLIEPWPLELIGHDGRATNVTMEPGDMILYESHSVLHGRPFPLKGRFAAMLFLHFEPTGHTLRHHQQQGAAASPLSEQKGDVDKQYREALEQGRGGHENNQENSDGLPPYIIPGTPEETNWREEHPEGYEAGSGTVDFATGSTTPAHRFAQNNMLPELKEAVENRPSLVNHRDENGWTPLHEGAYHGHLGIVEYLVEKGADTSATTYGDGATALWWARFAHSDDHPVTDYLWDVGALLAGPSKGEL